MASKEKRFWDFGWSTWKDLGNFEVVDRFFELWYDGCQKSWESWEEYMPIDDPNGLNDMDLALDLMEDLEKWRQKAKSSNPFRTNLFGEFLGCMEGLSCDCWRYFDDGIAPREYCKGVVYVFGMDPRMDLVRENWIGKSGELVIPKDAILFTTSRGVGEQMSFRKVEIARKEMNAYGCRHVDMKDFGNLLFWIKWCQRNLVEDDFVSSGKYLKMMALLEDWLHGQ